jgi:CRP/FNR family transcriptional regulator, cyclic AMP receptor protein
LRPGAFDLGASLNTGAVSDLTRARRTGDRYDFEHANETGAPALKTLADHCAGLPVVSFAAGEILLPEGARTGRLLVLVEGTVEILKGDFQINRVSDRGAVFGDMSVLLDIPHMATVRALTAGSAHFSYDGDAFLQSNSEVAYMLAKTLAQRLNGVTTYLADIKRQFEDERGHLGMVDEILESLLNQQRQTFSPGSDRDP